MANNVPSKTLQVIMEESEEVSKNEEISVRSLLLCDRIKLIFG